MLKADYWAGWCLTASIQRKKLREKSAWAADRGLFVLSSLWAEDARNIEYFIVNIANEIIAELADDDVPY